MIVFNDLNIMTRSDVPDADWTGEARYVVDDGGELAAKIMSCAPFFEPVEGADGELTDIIPLPRPEPPLEEYKDYAIAQTKILIDEELKRGVQFDGQIYNACKEKQDLLANQLGLYVMNTQAGIPDTLTWNTKDGVCEEWSYDKLLLLANALKETAVPLQKKQQSAEIEIKAAETREQIDAVLADFM